MQFMDQMQVPAGMLLAQPGYILNL
jgi:hypothetical protein